MKKYRFWLSLTMLLCWIGSSCTKQTTPNEKVAVWNKSGDAYDDDADDLDAIEESGDLIVGFVSGPETYYEYHGMRMGVQYKMVENFANTLGLRVRPELSNDTTELLRRLQNGEIDVIAMEMKRPTKTNDITLCAQPTDSTGWITLHSSGQLTEEINHWYKPNIKAQIIAEMTQHRSKPMVRRKVHSPMIGNGVISTYDALFRTHARTVGWDWRLLAAQCYQESGFDPGAVSVAGAGGLMQIMPETARELGLAPNDRYNPEKNIAASTRYLKRLDNLFADIPNRMERTKFILAAYNGGYHHIRDAMRLAETHHKDATRWETVSFYILHLSEAAYYQHPVVKYGYMRGDETYHYVENIMTRWNNYRSGVPGGALDGGSYLTPTPSKKHRGKASQVVIPEEVLQEREKENHI